MGLITIDDLNAVERMIINRMKKTMLDNGVKFVLMGTDQAGEVTFETFYEPVKVLTITQMKQLISELDAQKQLSNGNDADTNADTNADAAANG